MNTRPYLPKFDSLIFDLDGTLWDASGSTAKGWNTVAKKLGLDLVFQASDIKSVSGLPFQECVRTLFKESSIIPELANLLDRAEKEEILLTGGSLYSGVKDGLFHLSKQYKIFLVSNCQDWYLKAFLKHSGLQEMFVDSICFGQTGLPKTENIRNLTKKHGLKKAVYIGDTHWDQHASFYAGVKFIFAKYGFGSVNSNRCLTAHSFDELVEILSETEAKIPEVEIRKLSPEEFDVARNFYLSLDYVQPLNPTDKFYGAFHNAELKGLVRLATEEGSLVLRGMQVKPQYQFSGIGTRLIRLLEKDLEGIDCFCIPHGWLDKFYGQIGFRTVDQSDEIPSFLSKRLADNLKRYPEMILMKRDQTAAQQSLQGKSS